MYWGNISSKDTSRLDNYRTINRPGGNAVAEFYELEAAVVVDIILDENHPYITTNKISIVPDNHQRDFEGKPADPSDIDYSYIGRALVRPLVSGARLEKEDLVWAIPMESNISEYPVINEVVIVGRHLGKFFYSKKLNFFNLPNSNTEFSLERTYGGDETALENGDPKTSNHVLYSPDKPIDGPISNMALGDRINTQGVSGNYFWVNKNIRQLKRHEGDTIFESRFGQSIRFGAYDDNRENDVGSQEYKDYYGLSNNAGKNSYTGMDAGGGNPFILIRNRQRPLLKSGEKKNIEGYDKLSPLEGTPQEKNAGGYILENINYDGTSIHITCGLTISQFQTTCYKKMFGVNEEVNGFVGKSNFKYPILNGDQMVVNTSRVIVQSRSAETFHFSKKRYSVVTDSEYTLDAQDQIVMTTNNKVVLNSPAIYLGQYDKTDEPVLLGQTSVNWLYDLCEWLKQHTHWHKHGHVNDGAGRAVPDRTQFPVEIPSLVSLQSQLHTLMSRRVFVTGGGFAPGENGGSIQNGTPPLSISVGSGAGVPGGWKGVNKR